MLALASFLALVSQNKSSPVCGLLGSLGQLHESQEYDSNYVLNQDFLKKEISLKL